jgi:hypothetical protein
MEPAAIGRPDGVGGRIGDAHATLLPSNVVRGARRNRRSQQQTTVRVRMRGDWREIVARVSVRDSQLAHPTRRRRLAVDGLQAVSSVSAAPESQSTIGSPASASSWALALRAA